MIFLNMTIPSNLINIFHLIVRPFICQFVFLANGGLLIHILIFR
ncbi:hypothetical protein BaLi_c11620 [Bacillus paralicheniformis ATCC 9945a]|nr:hypothetical protein BaLi_c11620 [Bacillus paralicheniformis ATCC 9945a]